jgi:hypothetical protein
MSNPIRCEIVDVEGQDLGHGMVARTPEISRPHIGKLGYAHRVEDTYRIELDDGTVLWGYQCWWNRVEEAKDE